jgi:hypothetical protein
MVEARQRSLISSIGNLLLTVTVISVASPPLPYAQPTVSQALFAIPGESKRRLRTAQWHELRVHGRMVLGQCLLGQLTPVPAVLLDTCILLDALAW